MEGEVGPQRCAMIPREEFGGWLDDPLDPNQNQCIPQLGTIIGPLRGLVWCQEGFLGVDGRVQFRRRLYSSEEPLGPRHL